MMTAVQTNCVLTIENGFQFGAALPLQPGVHRVGGDLTNDVVVIDPELTDSPFSVEHGKATRLHATSTDLRLQNGSVLRAGRSITVRSPLNFSAGSTRFHLDPNKGEARRTFSRGSQVTTFVAAALLGAALLVITASPAETSPSSVATIASDRVVAKAPEFSVAEVAKSLSSRLHVSGLAGLRSELDTDGTVTVAGSLLPGQQPAWSSVKQWFDSTYGMKIALIDRVSLNKVAAPLSVAAVRSDGASPFVIDQSGQKLFVGSSLPGGWTVDAIEQTRVLVKRNSEMLAVSF